MGLKAFAVLAALAMTALPAAAADRKVEIVNKTDVVIVEFYGSSAGVSSWEEDILGEDVVGAGESVRIDFADGTDACVFDFKAVFADGDEVVQERINVCEIGTFTYE